MKKKAKKKKERILDKMVMAIYLNVGNLDEKSVTGHVRKLKLSKKYKDLEVFWIVDRNQKKSRIEILHVPLK